MGAPPPIGTLEYTWWEQGALAEAEARREGLSQAELEMLDWLTEMFRGWNRPIEEVLAVALQISSVHMSRWQRLKLVLRTVW